MNDAALSLIDVDRLELRATVLLDDLDRGAANPWRVAWSEAGRVLGIAHSGTHELSLVSCRRRRGGESGSFPIRSPLRCDPVAL
jgi:hypothetical protein